MSNYFTYILFSKDLDRYYVGASGNVEVRLEKHLQKHMGFTSKAKDWTLVYTEKFASKEEAMKRERQIKKWKSRKMIEKLITS